MQTPQIYRTLIELEGLDNLPAALALSQSMSIVREKLSVPSPESAKPLLAISMQALTQLTSPVEKWANSTGMMTQDTAPRS